MFRHFSAVNHTSVLTIGISGVIQFGDTNSIQAKNRSIAVQREIPYYFDEEANFQAFRIFQDTEITIPTRTTNVRMHTINENPFICVDTIEITNLLNAAVFHVGNIDDIFCNSRILQIRQYVKEKPFNNARSSGHNI
ncbi:MAG: spore germination protein GerPE [Ectobacillus sp.]